MSPYQVMSVARNMCSGPDKRSAEGAEIEKLKASRRKGYGVSLWAIVVSVLGYLELEKAHLIATNLSYLTFLRHIFSHIHIHNY